MYRAHLIIALLASMLGSTAAAQQGFYLGIGLGQSAAKVNGTPGFDATDVGYALEGGYRFRDGLLPWSLALSVEAGLVDLGKPDETILGQNVSFTLDGAVVYALVTRPIGERWALMGKLGVIDYDSKVKLDDTLITSKSDTDTAAGIGAELRLKEQLRMRFQLEGFSVLDDGTSLLSFSLVYHF
jgi:hypothetical protein